MRSMCGVIGLALVGACSGPPASTGPMSWDANLSVRSSGVELFADGDTARMGMNGTTCDVYVTAAEIGNDYDYPGDTDTVLDVRGADVLVSTESGLWLQSDGPVWVEGTAGVVDAAFVDAGVVATVDDVIGGCLVIWVGDAPAVAHVDYSLCSHPTSFTADPATGAVWIGTHQGLYMATEQDVARVDAQADLVVWDATTSLLYLASDGAAEVRAEDIDGAEQWSTTLEGAVHHLTPLGNTGRLAVSLARDDGTGAMVFLDGWTGEPVTEQHMPAWIAGVAMSDDGGRMALVHEESVDFFTVTGL